MNARMNARVKERQHLFSWKLKPPHERSHEKPRVNFHESSSVFMNALMRTDGDMSKRAATARYRPAFRIP